VSCRRLYGSLKAANEINIAALNNAAGAERIKMLNKLMNCDRMTSGKVDGKRGAGWKTQGKTVRE